MRNSLEQQPKLATFFFFFGVGGSLLSVCRLLGQGWCRKVNLNNTKGMRPVKKWTRNFHEIFLKKSDKYRHDMDYISMIIAHNTCVTLSRLFTDLPPFLTITDNACVVCVCIVVCVVYGGLQFCHLRPRGSLARHTESGSILSWFTGVSGSTSFGLHMISRDASLSSDCTSDCWR